MERFKVAPARSGESSVYGAERPGYDSRFVDKPANQAWVTFVKDKGIQRVCCLLPPKQLAYYRVDLLGEYKAAFGEGNVLHAPVEDFHLCNAVLLEDSILPFLANADRLKMPTVVHCSGGIGRTGHILAAWLVRHRGTEVDTALAEVRSTGRNPREAVDTGRATLKELKSLLGRT
jgi:protein-tyrosine phosphatase